MYRPEDFVVVCHIPELSEADLPTFSLKRKSAAVAVAFAPNSP